MFHRFLERTEDLFPRLSGANEGIFIRQKKRLSRGTTRAPRLSFGRIIRLGSPNFPAGKQRLTAGKHGNLGLPDPRVPYSRCNKAARFEERGMSSRTPCSPSLILTSASGKRDMKSNAPFSDMNRCRHVPSALCSSHCPCELIESSKLFITEVRVSALGRGSGIAPI